MQHVAKCLGLSLLCASAQAWPIAHAHAKDTIQRAASPRLVLPDLYTGDASPGHLQLDDYRAAIGYDARHKKWDARIDGYLEDNRSLGLDYGTLLSEHFSAGLTMTHRDDYSEVLVNGVYAPQSDVRIQMTSGQQRSVIDPFSASESGTVLQNSYLLGVRKHWDERLLSPDIGVAAYTVEANGDGGASDAEAGTLDGYMLDLSIQPTPQTRIEWRHDIGHLTQQFDGHASRDRMAAANRIGYLHQFDNCVRLQGRFSAGEESGRLELGVARNNWDVGISRSQYADSSDMAVHVGYRIPLGKSRSHPRSCSHELESERPFDAMVDVATRRPTQLPQAPITAGDSALSSGALAP